MESFIPWVEKYRPTSFEKIVLDPLNKKIFENIIKNQYFPNLLFYGPPGTGKTTSIINLIKEYQDRVNDKNLVIHLNASDERGIDTIRNQISSFVNSKSLFTDGMKYVVLDEVDYMTKNAQIALKYLLQSYKSNVRFCLICNYISRIEETLQYEFVRLRFNQLPKNEIIAFLKKINNQENLRFSNKVLENIQMNFNSDIRSMINYMQSNKSIIVNKKIIDNDLWENLLINIKKNNIDENNDFLNNISYEYNIEKKNIIKTLLNYIIRCKKELVTQQFLDFCENVMHIVDCNTNYLINYCLCKLKTLL
tara:strand:+ start:2430 stop:3350 length:921 start_codon:yes stop_codon:yes gene_type:complete